jgi:hypothetical protein
MHFVLSRSSGDGFAAEPVPALKPVQRYGQGVLRADPEAYGPGGYAEQEENPVLVLHLAAGRRGRSSAAGASPLAAPYLGLMATTDIDQISVFTVFVANNPSAAWSALLCSPLGSILRPQRENPPMPDRFEFIHTLPAALVTPDGDVVTALSYGIARGDSTAYTPGEALCARGIFLAEDSELRDRMALVGVDRTDADELPPAAYTLSVSSVAGP